MEMKWLHEHGLISNYEDYLDLPPSVIEDARILMAADSARRERDDARVRS